MEIGQRSPSGIEFLLSETQFLSASASSGCNVPTVGASSHMVKFDRLRAVSSTSALMGDTMRADSSGWFCDVMSWVKESGKEGEAVMQRDDSSVLRRSGDGSDSIEASVWLGVETLGSPLAGCPSGEVGTLCSGR